MANSIVNPQKLMRFQSLCSVLLSILVVVVSIAFYYSYHQTDLGKKIFHFSNEKIESSIRETVDTLLLSSKIVFKKLWSQKPYKDVIVRQLLDEESKVDLQRSARIAVGFGLCTDLIVEALDVLDQFKSPEESKPHDNIDSMQSFLELFAYYFQHGTASERFIESKQVFNELIKLIHKPGVKLKKMIGSNAALMSIRFINEGFQSVLLGAQATSQLTETFSKNLQFSGPIVDSEDYHVLLEFKTNQKWGHFTSPRSNRLIIHSDENNAKLLSRNFFFEQLEKFRPDLLIITGLHMLDMNAIRFEERAQTVDQVANDLIKFHKKSDQKFRVHFEMASYTESRLLSYVTQKVFPFVDSFGMNEQEAANLVSLLTYGNISYSSNPFPRVALVLDEMRELFLKLQELGSNRVSRIHVHTLAFQVVMVKVDDISQQPKWRSSSSAMARASLAAFRYTCDSANIDSEKVEILLDDSFSISLNQSSNSERIDLNRNATNCWFESLNDNHANQKKFTKVQICLAVGVVCKKVVQTGGAGDNISAAGLILQI